MVVTQEKLHEQYQKDTKLPDGDEVRKLNRPFTPLGRVVSFISIVLSLLAIWQFTNRSAYLYFLGGLMLAWLLIKKMFALCYRSCKKELTREYKVSVILTCFNEEPASVTTVLAGIMALDYPVHEVIFLDDGSEDPLAYQVAVSFAQEYRNDPDAPTFHIIRFEENRGKREVMADGFVTATGDYVFLLDSDVEILPNALTELLRPFEDGKTSSVVGNLGVLDKKKNFLTRLQSFSYFGAFQLGRAAQSVTGNVVICSGAFSIHKKDFILEHLEAFQDTHTVFGIKVSSGDDRMLTTFSKKAGGKARFQNTAYGETTVPDTWRKFLKQRRRWQRSGYLSCLQTIKILFPKHWGHMLFSFAESYFWMISTIIFIALIVNRGYLYIDWRDMIRYFLIITYMHNIFYMYYKPVRFLLAPIYFLVYGVFLTVVRVYTLLTLTNDSWGTRADEEPAFSEESEI